MAGARRKRTVDEQALYDEVESLKKLRAEHAEQITAALDRLYSVGSADETDAVLGAHARAALAARRRLDETNARIVALTERYRELRARRTEDVPL